MKLFLSALLVSTALSFSPQLLKVNRGSALWAAKGLDLSGNTWKPDSGKMGVSSVMNLGEMNAFSLTLYTILIHIMADLEY